MDSNQQIIAWLRDAYAMEQSLENVLQLQINDSKEVPDVQARLEQHLAQTREHSAKVKAALSGMGETTSALKSAAGNIMGLMQGVSMAVFRDEMLKGIISNYAMEHFEIACYRSLRVAANEAGLTDLAEMCEEILAEETQMAEWLEEQIPDMTRAHLHSLSTP
jgi:ferritin-like metal-binding protein YciE